MVAESRTLLSLDPHFVARYKNNLDVIIIKIVIKLVQFNGFDFAVGRIIIQ